MKLYNLKHKEECVSFTKAAIQGIGSDEGLFFIDNVKKLSDPNVIFDKSFNEIAYIALSHLLEGELQDDLKSLIDKAFVFEPNLKKIDDSNYSLELFTGPTLAFKDYGARFMASVLEKITDKKITILTATSGDTGAAVASAFYKKNNIDVFVLYPKGKISKLQEKLIATYGDNIHAIEIEGTFDDCQDMVKQAFLNADFSKKVGLNSANSINVSRLFAQVCYYLFAFSRMKNEVLSGKLSICVPCGNFGNICAGLIAKAITGFNVEFIVSCNENDTVPRYLDSKKWDPKATIATLSNAMDISRPNNWPRVEALYKMQNEDIFTLKHGTCDDKVTKEVIYQVYKDNNYLLEPHAAVAFKVLKEQKREGNVGLILGTAHPCKFKDTVESIINEECQMPQEIKDVLFKENKLVTMKKDEESLLSYVLKELKL